MRGLVMGAVGVSLAAVAGGGVAAQGTPQPGAARVDTTVTLRSVGSAPEFVPDRLSLRHGLVVRLRYVNDGTLPHNFVLVRSEEHLDLLAHTAYEAGMTGFVPLEHKDKLIAYTALVSPGETVEITFTVPDPGEYPFICLFPGHANMMVGTLRALR